MTQQLTDLLNEFRELGGVYHVYPRLKKVSLNGWPRVSFDEAISLLLDAKNKRDQRVKTLNIN